MTEQLHTTCYIDTFITVAPDSPAAMGNVPPVKEGASPSVAARTFELIAAHPYELTSDDVIFIVWADRRDLAEPDREPARREFFSKGQACLRASDLGKKYGWGIHHDGEGRVALYAQGSEEYAGFAAGSAPDGTPVTVRPAMRSARRSV